MQQDYFFFSFLETALTEAQTTLLNGLVLGSSGSLLEQLELALF